MALKKLNLAEAFESFSECWSPRVAGEVNECQVKLAKLDGAFFWHHHGAEDELFLVVKGALTMHVRDEAGERAIELGEGDMLIVPRGVDHLPEVKDGECWVFLVEPATTLNTGNVENERTLRTLPTIR